MSSGPVVEGTNTKRWEQPDAGRERIDAYSPEYLPLTVIESLRAGGYSAETNPTLDEMAKEAIGYGVDIEKLIARLEDIDLAPTDRSAAAYAKATARQTRHCSPRRTPQCSAWRRKRLPRDHRRGTVPHERQTRRHRRRLQHALEGDRL